MEKTYVDTNIFVYLLTSNAAYGLKAKNFFDKCMGGKPEALTSVYTLAEINVVLKRHGLSKKVITNSLQAALGLNVKFLPLNEKDAMLIPSVMSKGFSFGDSVHIVTMEESGIKMIVSSDPDFERAGFRRVFL